MTERLLALAAAFLARLGFILLSVGEARSVEPYTVLGVALVTSWLPLRPLGLPGDYTPQTGGEP